MAAKPFDWAEYLPFAQELATRTDEAALRSAISRAYYFVYHLALKRVIENNSFMKLDEGGMHAQVWAVFSGNPDPDCQRLGELGNRLRDKRVRADYKEHYPRIEDDVPAILADTQDFATLFRRLDRRHPSSRSIRR